MKTHTFRLLPGQDLRAEINKFAKEKNISAGVILTCAGNLKKAVLRMADAAKIRTFEGSFEIVSFVGTLEANDCHFHMSISDEHGSVFGGHVKAGCIVGTTAEVVIGILENTSFSRELDKSTGYNELIVKKTED